MGYSAGLAGRYPERIHSHKGSYTSFNAHILNNFFWGCEGKWISLVGNGKWNKETFDCEEDAVDTVEDARTLERATRKAYSLLM